MSFFKVPSKNSHKRFLIVKDQKCSLKSQDENKDLTSQYQTRKKKKITGILERKKQNCNYFQATQKTQQNIQINYWINESS